jgi:SSS family solute:Na+ symporter
MGISWGALAGSFLGPFLFGLYWKRTTKAAVWVSFITGVGITVSNMFIGYISSPINAGVYAMLVSIVIVPLVSLLTKRPDPESSEKIFSCYEKKASVQDQK